MVYGIGILVGRALSFVLLPLYTRYLSPADYGVIQLVELTFDILTLVAGSRLAVGVFHFYHKASASAERGTVLSTALMTISAGYLLVGLLAFLAAPQLSGIVFSSAQYTDVIRIAAASFPFQGMMIVPLAAVRVYERPRLFVALNTGRLLGQAILNVVFLVGLDMGIASFFASNLITSAVLGAGTTIWMLRSSGTRFSWESARALTRFGVPLVVTQLATLFTTFGDRYFLQRAADEAAVGRYALAYQFGFLLLTVAYEPFSSTWAATRFGLVRRADRDRLFSRIFLLLNIALLSGAVLMALFARMGLSLLTTEGFHAAADVVPVLLLAYVFQAWSGTQDTTIMLHERTSYISIANWASAVAALAGYVLLIPPYQSWGAAWSTCIALFVRWLFIYVPAQRLERIDQGWRHVLPIMALGTIVVALHVAFSPRAGVAAFAAAVGWAIAYGVGLLFLVPGEMRRQLATALTSPRRFLSEIATASGPAAS